MALKPKQKKALELLTSGQGLKFQEIADMIGVSVQQLWNWRTQPQFEEFQAELKKLDDLRWAATIDAARNGCLNLCKEGNQKMIEFVLKNAGYNPTQKVEADVRTDIDIIIDEN